MTCIDTLPFRVIGRKGDWTVYVHGKPISRNNDRFSAIADEEVQKTIREFYDIPDNIQGVLFLLPNKYILSSEGFVYSPKTRKMLNSRMDYDGNLIVHIYNRGKQGTIRVAHTVMKSFSEYDNVNRKVVPKDGNKTNCRFNNLEWSYDKKREINRAVS